jgi:hypothetical protein
MKVMPRKIGSDPDMTVPSFGRSDISSFKKFFCEIGSEMGILDWKEAAEKYYGIVRVIGRNLLLEGRAFLPDLAGVEVKDMIVAGKMKKYVKFSCHPKLSKSVNACNAD